MFLGVKMLLLNLFKQFFRSMNTVKKKSKNNSTKIWPWLKKKNNSSNMYWICKKLIDDEKVVDHYHVTGKFWGAAFWSWNIDLHLTKELTVMFHNLRDYDSHLISYELKIFDVKIDVIPNRLEKYMTLILNKNLVFIDSMQFMNSSLEKLVKNLSNNDFKYLTEEFGSKNLKLLKQKDAYPYEYMDSFKRFSEEKLPDNKYIYSSVKDGTTSDNGDKP